MRFGKFLTAVAVASMATAPVMAAPAASKLSVSGSSSVRAASQAGESNELRGGGFFVAILAAIAVIAGVIILAKSDDSPDSP